jgi:ribosomal silencing factor RsfS
MLLGNSPRQNFVTFAASYLIVSSRALVLADHVAARRRFHSPMHRKVDVNDIIASHLIVATPFTMSLSRAFSSSFVCSACQRAAARSSKLPLNGTIQRASLKTTASPSKSTRRVFSTINSVAKDRTYPTAADPEFAFLDEGTNPETGNTEDVLPPSAAVVTETTPSEHMQPSQSVDSAPTTNDSSVPWYLRQQSILRDQAQTPIEIPDLPPNPPPLLKTLLEYISITAGLDDLQMLDLRHLDPPPALGPKLIMIIATARSEKHLHVAADGFARYLRREHGLKANAAGLLGRNELKIKLRRKAKRMRMLANVGGTVPEGNIDDGIRTGWICCTLSKIEAHPDDLHMPGDNVEEFVGFRDVKPGVNVVVQMFTEEKRAETDLETLWGGVLKTHQRQDKAAEDKLRGLTDLDELEYAAEAKEEEKRDMSQAEPVPPAAPARPIRPLPSTPGDMFPPSPGTDTARQLRRLHTVGLR